MASRERDDAMAGLLKRSLAGDGDAANDCPAPDILAAYFERSLDREEEAGMEVHFSKCARCREQLAALGRAEGSAVTPAISAPKGARASWLWDWRWLAPVAAVLVISAVWATRRPALTRIAEHPAATSSIAPTESAGRATTQSAAPEQQSTRTVTLQAAPEAKKKEAPRAGTSPPNGVPPALQSAPMLNSGAPAADAENSQTAKLPSATNLPLNAREITELKKAPAPPPAPEAASADEVSKARVSATTAESVAVESAESSVATAPAPPQSNKGAVGGAIGGMTSGAVSAKTQPSNAKQSEQPALVHAFRDRPAIISANQLGQLLPDNVIRTPDPRIMWRFASGGFVERSEDGGRTWKGQLPNQSAHYTAGSAPGTKICWLIGDNGVILLTEDALNWQTIPPPADADFVAVRARDASSATVTAADGRKFTTTNRGKAWNPVE